MSSLPSALTAAGTFAASAWSTPEALVVAVLPPPLLLLPHAATTKVKPRPRASSRHLRALLNMFRPYRPGRRAAPQRPLISNCRIPCHATHADTPPASAGHEPRLSGIGEYICPVRDT